MPNPNWYLIIGISCNCFKMFLQWKPAILQVLCPRILFSCTSLCLSVSLLCSRFFSAMQRGPKPIRRRPLFPHPMNMQRQEKLCENVNRTQRKYTQRVKSYSVDWTGAGDRFTLSVIKSTRRPISHLANCFSSLWPAAISYQPRLLYIFGVEMEMF